MKSRGDRLEHRAVCDSGPANDIGVLMGKCMVPRYDTVVDERGHQGALLHRPFRPTEVRRFGEGHSGRMPVADDQNNWRSHEASKLQK